MEGPSRSTQKNETVKILTKNIKVKRILKTMTGRGNI